MEFWEHNDITDGNKFIKINHKLIVIFNISSVLQFKVYTRVIFKSREFALEKIKDDNDVAHVQVHTWGTLFPMDTLVVISTLVEILSML